ncbi:hypothetical protein F4818DRAFT_445602 [Hypoxylon cercidicola]|nr:hypothetical protein F4818DRAFT_445602 [Hypoxylon cercidicola]
MADLSHRGVEIPLPVHTLISRLYDTASAAEERSDQLTNEYAKLKAEHCQLVVDYNKNCNDADGKSKEKTKESLYDDLVKSTGAAVNGAKKWRQRAIFVVNRYQDMAAEIATLKKKTAALQRENEALKAQAKSDLKGESKMSKWLANIPGPVINKEKDAVQEEK